MVLLLSSPEGELGGKQVRRQIMSHNEAMKFNELQSIRIVKVNVLRFDHLCYGQWTSMVNLKPRLPVKNQATLNDITTESIGGKSNVNSSSSTVTKKPDFEIIDEVEDD
jgi:hypothetical protein